MNEYALERNGKWIVNRRMRQILCRCRRASHVFGTQSAGCPGGESAKCLGHSTAAGGNVGDGSAGEIAGRITGKARYLSFERAREYTAGHWICSAEKAKRELNFAPAAPLAERLNRPRIGIGKKAGCKQAA